MSSMLIEPKMNVIKPFKNWRFLRDRFWITGLIHLLFTQDYFRDPWRPILRIEKPYICLATDSLLFFCLSRFKTEVLTVVPKNKARHASGFSIHL